jgi:hypothetical protein
MNVDEMSTGTNTDYNALSQGQKDTYLVNAPNAVVDILSVSPYNYVLSPVDTGSGRLARALVRSAGGTLTQGAGYAPSNSIYINQTTASTATGIMWVLQTDPETGVAWTATRLQTTEFGLLADTTSDVFRINVAGAEIVYRASDGTGDAFIVVQGREPTTAIPTTGQIIKRISTPITGTAASTATGTVTASG